MGVNKARFFTPKKLIKWKQWMILYYSVNVYLSPLMLLVQWIVYTRLAIWSKVLYTREIQTPKQVVSLILSWTIFINSEVRT